MVFAARVKRNLSLLFTKTWPDYFFKEHLEDLQAFEKQCQQDSLNIRNAAFLSEFYGLTARALALQRNDQSLNSELNDPCYYFRRSLEIAENLQSKNALSPLRTKNRDALVKSMVNCAAHFH